MKTTAASKNLEEPASVRFDSDLLSRMAQHGPRYTLYPTADRFSGDFRMGDYLEAVARIKPAGARNPISLYIHIPFCESLCYYCGCNKIIRTHFINTSMMRSVQNRMMARVKQGFRTTRRPPAQRQERASSCAPCKGVPQRIVIYSQGTQHSQRRFWTEPVGKGRFGRIALLSWGRRGRLHREPPCASRRRLALHPKSSFRTRCYL